MLVMMLMVVMVWLMMEVVILMLMVGAVVSDSVGGDSNVDGDVDGGDSVSGECVGLQCPYHDTVSYTHLTLPTTPYV